MVHRPCSFAHHKLYFPIFILPYFSEQLLNDSFGNSGQTMLDPNSNPTVTQPNFNQSNRIRPSLNPKRPDDGSVKGISPLTKFLGICITISGHDFFASPINKNLGCLLAFHQVPYFQAFANLNFFFPVLVLQKLHGRHQQQTSG
jgi:hypothetical protein